jgi:hypothetical protein
MKKQKHLSAATCLFCGKIFEYYPSEKDGKYCSQGCYKKSRNQLIEVTCEYCGKKFMKKPSAIKEHTFCDNICRAKMWNNQVELTCKNCGKIFYKRESITKNYNSECCSRKCAGILKRNRIKRICKGCGTEFELKESAVFRDVERGKYCKKECYTKFARGKNSHMYDHGQSFYPYCEVFNEPLKERVRHFFGDVCVICGATKEQNQNKKMGVHHVFIEKLACCEDKIIDKDLVRKRLPSEVACFGNPEFTPIEIMYIRMMVPLCMGCHGDVHQESNDLSYDDTLYRKLFAELIVLGYNGKCKFTE